MKHLGLALFFLALTVFVLSLTMSRHVLTNDVLHSSVSKPHHRTMIQEQAEELFHKNIGNNIAFVSAIRLILENAKIALDKNAGVDPANGVWNAFNLPEGVAEWDYRMSDGDIKNYTFQLTKYSATGLLPGNKGLFLFLSIILGSIGALLYFLPDMRLLPGIKNNGIYHSSATRGAPFLIRTIFLIGAIITTAVWGIFKTFLPTVLTLVATLIIAIILWKFFQRKNILTGHRSASPEKGLGHIGLITAIFLIGFYILLYFFPEYITNWALMLDPVSKRLSGNPASQWFLYGFLYTIIMLVMGTRMLIKYRHNMYQIVRTLSVMFFQLAFAFLIPEFMVRLNQPYMDLKNAWPLNYSFFFDYNINNMIGQGGTISGMKVGTIMFVWGIVLTLIIVPLFTYLFGKRWYCSWVCGCGGLAETLGDPYRQLSDKSLRAWQIERYAIHSVLVFAVLMTGMVLYTYWTNSARVFFFDSYQLRSWYGFFIGSMFAGVVGTGFYPIMGNRIWCRFGCPLAAIMGIVQRTKSRFRITTNGGQCISCGNCSTYCEMGIDVRWYAQRQEDIVRASCVGCGVCSAVCPRGVLKLENGTVEI